MKANSILLVFFALSGQLVSQNLVPNPGFEPKEGSSFSWKNPTTTTPDYHSNEHPGWWVRNDPQQPHGGEAFMHISFSKSNHEYVRTKLLTSLDKGKVYCVSLFISLFNNGATNNFAIDQIGVAFTTSSLKRKVKKLIAFKNGVCLLKNEMGFLTDTEAWVKVCATYQAKGGERYLTIGTFGELEYLDIYSGKMVNDPGLMNASYFVDDVSLVEISANELCECHDSMNAFSLPKVADTIIKPIIDEVNEKTVVVKNVFFEFDKAELQAASYKELDKWGRYMTDHPNISISIEGHTDNLGVSEYNYKLSVLRAKAIYSYLVRKSIDPQRLSYKGYGDQYPVDDNETEQGRQNNRRVVFRIIVAE